MRIDLRPFFENDDLSLNIDYSFVPGDPIFSSPAAVRGVIKSSRGAAALSANADCSVGTQCARCAKDICMKLSVPVEHLIVARLNDDSNDDYILVEDMELDLDSLVTEDIFLTLPTKFLCREDCKGLCPSCGKDLNEGECGCEKEIDPRLAALKQLLSEKDD